VTAVVEVGAKGIVQVGMGLHLRGLLEFLLSSNWAQIWNDRPKPYTAWLNVAKLISQKKTRKTTVLKYSSKELNINRLLHVLYFCAFHMLSFPGRVCHQKKKWSGGSSNLEPGRGATI
jgi:hypothetical protein